MTFKKLFGFGLLLWLFLAIAKFFAFRVLDIDAYLIKVLFGLFIVVAATALSRRLGVINFLEASLAAVLWFAIVIFMDFLVLPSLLGFNYFIKWEAWVGYAIMMASVFFFHKKRHIHIRKEMAEHHGHH